MVGSKGCVNGGAAAGMLLPGYSQWVLTLNQTSRQQTNATEFPSIRKLLLYPFIRTMPPVQLVPQL